MKKNIWMNQTGRAVITTAMVTAFAAAAMAASCAAQEVIFTGEEAPFTIYQSPAMEADTALQDLKTGSMHVLGMIGSIEDESPAVVAVALPASEEEGELLVGFVAAQEIIEKIPAIAPDSLPDVTAWQDLSQGASGDMVQETQEALIELGMLDGTADGRMGPQTAASVSTFQQENALPATGVLDLFTYLYLQEKAEAEEPVESAYPPVFTVEDKFDDIVDDVEDASVLEAYTTPEWKYTYDAFEGEGLITKGTIMATYEESDRPVDTISMTVAPAVRVQREDTGVISVGPVLEVRSSGSYRPYVQSIILKSGNMVSEFSDAILHGQLVGTQVEETAQIPVTEEDLARFAGSDEPLQIRVVGSSRTYDMTGSLAE